MKSDKVSRGRYGDLAKRVCILQVSVAAVIMLMSHDLLTCIFTKATPLHHGCTCPFAFFRGTGSATQFDTKCVTVHRHNKGWLELVDPTDWHS